MIATPRSTPAPSPTLPSSFASDRYTVLGFLGEGGRKRVYLGHDTKLLASGMLKALVEGSNVAWREKGTVELKGLLGDHEI